MVTSPRNVSAPMKSAPQTRMRRLAEVWMEEKTSSSSHCGRCVRRCTAVFFSCPSTMSSTYESSASSASASRLHAPRTSTTSSPPLMLDSWKVVLSCRRGGAEEAKLARSDSAVLRPSALPPSAPPRSRLNCTRLLALNWPCSEPRFLMLLAGCTSADVDLNARRGDPPGPAPYPGLEAMSTREMSSNSRRVAAGWISGLPPPAPDRPPDQGSWEGGVSKSPSPPSTTESDESRGEAGGGSAAGPPSPQRRPTAAPTSLAFRRKVGARGESMPSSSSPLISRRRAHEGMSTADMDPGSSHLLSSLPRGETDSVLCRPGSLPLLERDFQRESGRVPDSVEKSARPLTLRATPGEASRPTLSLSLWLLLWRSFLTLRMSRARVVTACAALKTASFPGVLTAELGAASGEASGVSTERSPAREEDASSPPPSPPVATASSLPLKEGLRSRRERRRLLLRPPRAPARGVLGALGSSSMMVDPAAVLVISLDVTDVRYSRSVAGSSGGGAGASCSYLEMCAFTLSSSASIFSSLRVRKPITSSWFSR
mmetsp:Transcript_53143/g.168725  ORF Transcript_53143/g.168725 Transcript_53143/m.168725 type:complete len:542 (-) Transcript_53143:1696-3321(-)